MRHTRPLNQQGFASILISMVIVVILGLISVGFATLMRREQVQTLNRQLSTQAFYAAEAGINDAIAYLKTASAATVVTSTTCAGPTGYTYNKQLDGTNLEYTCLLIDGAPRSLEYVVGTDSSMIIPLDTGGTAINSIQIGWQDENGSGASSTSFSANPGYSLPSQTVYPSVSGTGLVRTTVMPVNNAGNIPDRDTLTARAATYFLYPHRQGVGTAGVNVGYQQSSTGNDGTFVDGACRPSVQAPTNKYCQSTITGPGGTDTVYVRLKALYKPVKVTLCVNNCTAPLRGAQAMVDSTGRAADVVRRIQVRVPLITPYDIPEFALETTQTICKRMVVVPGTGIGVSVPAGVSGCTVPSGPGILP